LREAGRVGGRAEEFVETFERALVELLVERFDDGAARGVRAEEVALDVGRERVARVAAGFERRAETPLGGAPPDGVFREHADRAAQTDDGLGGLPLIVKSPAGQLLDAPAHDLREHLARHARDGRRRALGDGARAHVRQLFGEECDGRDGERERRLDAALRRLGAFEHGVERRAPAQQSGRRVHVAERAHLVFAGGELARRLGRRPLVKTLAVARRLVEGEQRL
jgi:hypothetical protein